MAKKLSASERAGISQRALDAAKELAGASSESLDNLLEMDTDQLLSILQEHGVTLDEEVLDQKIRAAIGDDVLAIDRGRQYDEVMAQRLQERVERAVENAARSVARQTMRSARQEALLEGDDREDSEKYLMWVAALTRSCRSCETLHGRVFAADYWDGNGPGEGGTICGDNCRCFLVPVDFQGREGAKVPL